LYPRIGRDDLPDFLVDVSADHKVGDIFVDGIEPSVPLLESSVFGHGGRLLCADHFVQTLDRVSISILRIIVSWSPQGRDALAPRTRAGRRLIHAPAGVGFLRLNQPLPGAV